MTVLERIERAPARGWSAYPVHASNGAAACVSKRNQQPLVDARSPTLALVSRSGVVALADARGCRGAGRVGGVNRICRFAR